jgi:hypothetical protein
MGHRGKVYRIITTGGSTRELGMVPITEFCWACRRPGFADFLRLAVELDDSRFVSVQLQPKLREWLAQFCQKPLCFLTMFKSIGRDSAPKNRR